MADLDIILWARMALTMGIYMDFDGTMTWASMGQKMTKW
jgi:hypothetical protein